MAGKIERFQTLCGAGRANSAEDKTMKQFSRREFMRAVGAGAVALTSGCHALNGTRRPRGYDRPHILFVYSDDHANQAISAYGGRLAKVAPTPNIDRIANEGMIFQNSFVTNSICAPCRAVILTGKHSHMNGVRVNGDRFDGSQQTFPKLLQAAGYQTALIGKWHLRSDPTGFDHWDVLPGQGHYYNPDFYSPWGTENVYGYVTDIITDKALRWLGREWDKNKPFLLMVQNKAPHREWEPGPDHLTVFDGVTIPEPDNLFDDYEGRGTAAKKQDMTIAETMRLGSDLKVWDDEPEGRGTWSRTYDRMDDTQRALWDAASGPKNNAFRQANLKGRDLVRWKYQRYMKDYLRCIASIDDNVGRLLDYLETSGLDKNTVVIYSSDQSFYLGEHGWFDKRFIYEESFRTPLLAGWPGVIRQGSTAAELVQNLDMAETFLDIAGTSIPSDMQGKSLVPFMRGQSPVGWRTSIYYQYYEGEEAVHNVYKHYGVRSDRYKLVYFYTLDEWEFYDLETDPHEMHNQFANTEYADTVQTLKTELNRLRRYYKVPDDDTA